MIKNLQTDNLLYSESKKERLIIFIPSLTMGGLLQEFYSGITHYEERYLYQIFHLKDPKTKLVIVMSEGGSKILKEYFIAQISEVLGLLKDDIKKRLKIIEIPNSENTPLIERLLKSKTHINQLKNCIVDKENTYLRYYRVTEQEIELSKILDIPYYGLSPQSFFINGKSGAKELFKKAGVPFPKGSNNLLKVKDVYTNVVKLSESSKNSLYLLKINNEGAGVGIVELDLNNKEAISSYKSFTNHLSSLLPFSFQSFEKAFEKEGGILEEKMVGEKVASPSIQYEIYPSGKIVELSTHLQDMHGTEYVGALFPAPCSYRHDIAKMGMRIAKQAYMYGAQGKLAIDFIVTKNKGQKKWNIYAIEINARKGGTTHPYNWAINLTNSAYNYKTGLMSNGHHKIYYYVTDTYGLEFPKFKALKEVAFLNSLKDSGLEFNLKTNTGVFVHMLSTLEESNKVGITIIAKEKRDLAKIKQSLDSLFI